MNLYKPVWAAAFVTFIPLIGCASKNVDMDAMMQQPPRPAEMDYLAQLVGTWKVESEMKMGGSDEVLKSTGTDVITWSLGKRYIIENMTMDMGDGKVMKGLGMWTWDPRAKRFRTWWFDDWSGRGTSVASYCPKCRLFCFKGKTESMAMGYKTVGEGCFRFVDDDTMEWNWKERIPWTPFTVMEMSGTSRRQ